MSAKDFAPIENDYAFFMSHATEAENDAAHYVHQLNGFTAGRSSVHWLDFGCGTGDFTAQLLSTLNWPPDLLHLTLIEPVEHQRQQAAQRLATFSHNEIAQAASLPEMPPDRTADLIISNHVLYYVDNLPQAIQQMFQMLAPNGKMLLAIAGWENVLLQWWQTGFAMLGRPVPYHAAEDVEVLLLQQGIAFDKSPVEYQLRFRDTLENRLSILRFLFGDYLPQITPERLLPEFDRYQENHHITITTHSDHFTIHAQPSSLNPQPS